MEPIGIEQLTPGEEVISVNRKLQLLFLWFAPVLAGFTLGYALQSGLLRAHSALTSVALLALWALLSHMVRAPEDSALRNAVTVNVPAFIVLLLLLHQAYSQGEFGSHIFGVMMQMYYLPVIALAARIAALGFPGRIDGWLLYTVSFALMLVVSYIGSAWKGASHSFAERLR